MEAYATRYPSQETLPEQTSWILRRRHQVRGGDNVRGSKVDM